MAELDRSALFDRAAEILAENDRGAYTVPTKGLYPFQWNWDSCLTALGQRHLDEARAWTEIETLFSHQWPDGMVPHIVFHVEDEGYFPGAGVWRTERPTPTSGITQPPVAGFCVEKLHAEAKDRRAADARARALLPKLALWHRWFYANRDLEGTGLVAILHPWESGRDNSIDWDKALAAVPTEGVEPYTRRDTSHVDPSMRPTKAEYDRYLWLVQHFRGLGWDNAKLHEASPFAVVDPGFNAILIRSDEALGSLARRLGENELADEAEARLAKARPALQTLFDRKAGQYRAFDRKAGEAVESLSVGGILPLFAAPLFARTRADDATAALVRRIAAFSERLSFLVPSHDPEDPRFDAKRYWRGPAWLIVNYMIADGLSRIGEAEAAARLVADSLRLIETGGFAEYYDPTNGAALGGGRFTWTAAMVLEFLALERGALGSGAPGSGAPGSGAPGRA